MKLLTVNKYTLVTGIRTVLAGDLGNTVTRMYVKVTHISVVQSKHCLCIRNEQGAARESSLERGAGLYKMVQR